MSTPAELNHITHYRDAIAALQSIGQADSERLADLSAGMTASSFKNPYANAFHAAIFQRWAEVDIDDAVEHILRKIKAGFTHTHWLREGLTVLASIQPDYLLGKLEPITDTDIAIAVMRGVAANDPRKYATYTLSRATTVDGYSETDSYLPLVIFEWGDTDPKAAYEWVQTEAADVLLHTDLSPLMWKWFEKDPDTAIVEVERLLNNSDTTNPDDLYRYSEMYATHLVRSDPAAAYRWVREQEDPEIRDSMLTMVAYKWSDMDPQGLRDFFSQLEQGEQDVLRRYL